MDKFNLDRKLAEDTIFIKDFRLSKLLLMNDSNYPWFILVPKINNITELYELSEEEQVILMFEITEVSKIIKKELSPDKLNIGALGNIVKQLHIHIVAIYETDISWPAPIWGRFDVIPYDDGDRQVTNYKEIFA